MLIKQLKKKGGKYLVTFQIPCEQLPEDVIASQINVVGSFNNWSISKTPMSVADGIGFEAQMELKPGRYEFRYLINDHVWYNDWAADGYEPNRLENADNCILVLDKVSKPKKGKVAKKKTDKKSKTSAPKKKAKSEKVKAADDLKKIEGIGPKISSVLIDAGVDTFKALSKLSVDEIRTVLTGKVRIFHPDSWPQQAQLAAEGAWDNLKALQDSLTGGRKA